MGGMGGVGLVLIDPGRGLVGIGAGVVGGAGHAIGAWIEPFHLGPGQHHEVVGTPRHEEGIVRCQGDHHGTVATFADQIEAVIEELTKNCEQRVVRR